MDVVSEIVSAQGGATLVSANEHPNPAWHHSITQFLIKPVAFALMLSLGTAQILPAQAQVIADPSAPKSQQPTVLPTASGATQINIQTPSAAGVSMNQYRQFDTQTNGTVLNNSRTNTNTQTAGWIQANPWLATGSARVIVNQVNSSNPSRLTGNIEVAGQRADLIIANPSGININGAAIINAKRTTFTTGAPQLNNGNLTGYQVNQGQINIEGTGLNTQGSDYTDLLARAVKVNAGIWANNLAITTGANNINATNDNITPNAATGTAPTIAIDTSALGGMYAGKITLIGTEKGVGVNNAGQIAASAGNVTIDANGMLSNSGTINSNGAENATQIKSTQLANTGSISSQGNTQIQTANLTNSGTIAAGREAKLTATDLNNSTGTINGQRIDITANSLNNTQGKIQQTGTQALALNAGSISNLNNGLIGYEPLDSGSGTGSTGTGTGSTGTGTTTPPSTATGGGSSSVVQPVPVVLADGQINVQNHLNNDAGRITANGGIDLTASNGLENHATLSLNKLTVTGDRLDNSSGTITSAQLTANTISMNNTAGKLGASGDVALTSNNLTNSAGQITAGGTLNAQIAGVVLNDNGTIAADNSLALNAGALNNTHGTVASVNADATVNSNNALNNASGSIQSASALNVTANGIDNTDGTVVGGAVNVNSNGQSLNNTRGQVSGNALTVNSGVLNNDAGILQGNTRLDLNTHGQTLTNSNSGSSSGITSGGALTIQSGDLNNSTGYIGSTGAAVIQSAQVTNVNGQINSQNTLDLTGTGVDNRTGQIQSLGNLSIGVGDGTISNDTGLIRSGATTTLNAGTVINTNTQTANTGIEGVSVKINANTVDNTSGAIRADEVLNITGSGTVNNSNGLITSTNSVAITDPNATKTQTVINTNGTIIAGTNNIIDAKSLTGDGKVISTQDVSIHLTDDFTANTVLQAGNNLSLSSAGTITNNSQIIAGNANTVTAQNIDNKVNAEISSAKTQLTAIDTLSNRGLIDGGDTFIQADTVNNVGTGRIYGDHIAIGAGTLNNVDEVSNGVDTTATIAARSRLDIGAQIINNQVNHAMTLSENSTLFSGGDLAIGGGLDANHLAIGQANTLNNVSSTIESTGDMSLSVGQINNTNAYFASEIQVVKQERVSEVQGFIAGEASPTPLNPSAVYVVDPDKMATLPSLGNDVSPDYLLNAEYGVLIHNDQSNHLITPEGLYGNWNLKDFTRTTSESVVTSSDPAKIVAGGNLTLKSNKLLNDNSQVIVGGTLLGDGGAVLNQETLGQRIIEDVGTTNDFWRNHDKGRDSTGSNSAAYNVTHPTQSINISTSQVLDHVASPSGSGTTIGGLNTGNVTDTAAGAGSASVSATVFATNTTDPTLIKTGAVNTQMPNSSLFTVNPNNAGYYIQTDPRFANYRNWLSSDWMLNALNLDPANMHKRLGDGYYEQKLIKEQIAQLTGRRYLGDYHNDDTQYQALMNAGVTFAGQYNLRPGVALTAEQMARLTSDIVWLVEQEVTLPDGSRVTALVPKVYVAVKPGDIDGSGALISANSIQLNLTGDLNNAGTVSGRNVTQITAQNINNQGRINANQLDLQATNDLNNIGGTLDANTSASIRAGHDVNVTTTTNSASSQFGSQTTINRVAGIYVGDGADALMGNAPVNTLVIQAGNNVNLTAAQIDNAGIGNTVIKATQGDVNLSTVKLANTDTFYRDARNGHSVSETADVGSNINGVGNVTLSAGRDINAKAADVNSDKGTLAAVAGRDINLTTGQATRDTVADSYEENSGFLSSKKTTIHTDSSSNTAIASNFTGAQVILDAGHDANIIGSNVVSDNLTSIRADNNVNIKAATNTYSSDYSKEVKRSGLSGGFSAGVLSVGYSKSKTNATNDNQSTTQAASTVASLYGDTQVVAGNQLHVSASDIAAGDDITLVGKDIQLTAAQETNRQDSTYKSSSSGFSIGITIDPAAAFKSAYKNTYDNTPATGTVGKVTRLAEAVGAGVKAATTPVVVTAGSHTSSTENHTATSDARVSTVQAGGNLKMIATDGSITSQGSQISAEGDALLLAKDNINLDVAHNFEAQTSDSKASGWGFDNRMTGLPIGVYKNKANGDGSTDTVTGTSLSVGGKATLATTQGDINIIGSNAVSTGDMNLNAANNLNIVSAQNTAQNENHSNNKAIGKVVISDTERFMGYHSEKANNDNQTITQVSSNVGSLSGNVNATAGNQYTQIASNVVAGNDVNVTAKTIDIRTAQNTGDAHSDQSALKIGAFARVSSPIIDLVNNIEASSKSDGRLQAMQGMAAAGNAYQAGSAIASMAGAGYGSGSLLKAEVGIGVASNQSNDNSTYSTSVGNTIKAGNNVNLTSTEGDIHVQQTDMTAGNTIKLDSAKDILLEAGQSTSHTDGKHSNYGVEVGVGVSVGAQTGVYAYVAANAGKGKYNTDTVTNSNTHLTADKIQINSKGNTTLKGATATANSISTDVGGKLAIESLQDTAKQTSSESGVNARVQVSFGTAWEASGGVNASKGNGDFAQVTEQSGLFAGDGGYHVKAKEVDLKGGVIASTNAANSDLTADKFTHTDIQNHMSYDASSVSLSGSVSGGGGNNHNPQQTSGAQPHSVGDQLSNIGNTISTGNFAPVSGGSFTPSLPMIESGSDSSTTHATLSEGNITIGGQSTTAAATGVNTDASAANAQIAKLPNIQQFLNDQKAIASAVGTITSSATQAVSDKHDYEQSKADVIKDAFVKDLSPEALTDYQKLSDIKQQAYVLEHSSAYSTAYADAARWGTGGDYKRAADVVTAIVTGVGSGQAGGQVATNAIAPYAAELIGNAFDSSHGENPNKTAQILSHAVLGAVLAYANGGNAATGAVAGGGSEAAAQYLITQMYPDAVDANGVLHREQLSETQVQNVLALTNAIGAVVGGIGSGVNGGDMTAVLGNAAVDAYVAKNAVENNVLTSHQKIDYAKEKADCNGSTWCISKVEWREEKKSQLQDAMILWAKGKCLAGSCSDKQTWDQLFQDSEYLPAVVNHLKSAFPQLNDQEIYQLADEFISEQKQEYSGVVGKAVVTVLSARGGKGSKGANFGESPKNLSPSGAGRIGAFNQAKRDVGIPTSMQPSRTGPNIDKRGNVQPGRTYEYDVPQPGGGTKTITIRDDSQGHVFTDNPAQNRAPHFNTPNGGHYDY